MKLPDVALLMATWIADKRHPDIAGALDRSESSAMNNFPQ